MLYHDLLDCDRKLTVCGTSVLLAERIIPTDNGALSSNTRHRAPLERGNWAHRLLTWRSAGAQEFGSIAFY